MSDDLSTDLASLRIDRSSRQRGPWGRIAIVLGVLVVVGAAVSLGKPLLESRVFKVEVEVTEIAIVSPAQASVELTATGYVTPQVTAKVGAKVLGRISKVNLREGQTVKAGDVLFELDPLDQQAAVQSSRSRVFAAQARVATAQAQSAENRVNLDRQKKLADTGSVARATVDDLHARQDSLDALIKAAQADVNAAQAETHAQDTGLANLRIAAPIDGTAVTKPASVGDIAGPSGMSSLVELVDYDSLLVEADVPEARLSQAKVGVPCEIVLDALAGQRFAGVVAEVGPRINRAKATGLVKVKFESAPKELRPEMSARVSFLKKALAKADLREATKTAVPASAVFDVEGGKAVWVIEEGKIHKTPISLGDPLASGFVLASGPIPGTRIVNNPSKDLVDDKPIKEKAAP